MKKKLTKIIFMSLRGLVYGTVLQVFFISILFAEGSEAQTIQSVRDATISINLQSASIRDCFSAIERQTNYKFSYDHDLIDNSIRINFRAHNRSVSDLLMEISKRANLRFKQINNNINVQKQLRKEEPQVEVVMQGIQVSGTITSGEDGSGLPGVNILVKGTTIGTITDVEGHYTLEVPSAESILVISSLGYIREEVTVGGKTTIDMVMQPDITSLEEIVVVGYGVQKKKDVTGAIVGIDAETINERGVTDPIQSLQGSVAGVQISNSTGRLGDGFNVTIRGKNTLDDDSEPLYVVNGVVTDNIDFLNPQDIAKIDILKDASSAAIYGSRGSNGVIIIQTKGGESIPSGTSVAFETFFGVKEPARLPKMMSAEKWKYYHMSAYLASVNSDVVTTPEEFYDFVLPESSNAVLRERFDNNDDFDWYDAILKTGYQSNSHLSITHREGGSSYSFGLGYQNETGNIDNESLDKYTLRLTMDQEINKQIKTGGSISFSLNENQRGSDVAMRDAFRLNPFLSPWAIDEDYNEIAGELFDYPGKLKDPDGNTVINKTSTYNPLLEIANSSDETRSWNGVANAYLQYKPVDWITLKSTLSVGLDNYRRGKSWSADTEEGASYEPAAASSEETHFENFNLTWDNQVNVTKSFNEHVFNLLGLQSIYVDRTESSYISSANQSFDTEFYNVGSGEQSTFNIENDFLKSQLASFALRLNYSFMDKYLITVSNRWDGSSLLADGYKWDAFPSAAIGWRLSEESFMENVDPINNLKVRVSYGFTGNNSVSPYSSLNNLDQITYYDYDGDAVNGWVSSSIANTTLTWEKTEEINVGLDFGILKNRITGSFDWYNRLSEDLLLSQNLPLESGYTSIASNAGSVRNKGVEIMVTTNNIQTQNFTWSTTFSFSKNKNTIESIYGQTKDDDVGNGWFIGQSIDVLYNYKFDGIWQADESDMAESYNQSEGQAKVVDVNDDGKIDPDDDRVFLGSSDPSWTGGLISRITYKNFDFNFTINTKQGVMVYSNFHSNFTNTEDRGRQKLDLESWYIPENDYGVEPMFSNKYPQGRNMGTYWKDEGVGYYKDASYVKVTNISLGYRLPQPMLDRLNITQLRVYLNVLNPFVFTDYEGWDPEWAGADLGIGRVSTITTQLGVSVKF